MSSRRARIEADAFARRRAVAALLHGDSLDLEDLPRGPAAAVAGGLVLVLLIAAVTAGTSYVSGRAPDGWRKDGTLVLDKQTGSRYVVLGQQLRPAPTLTAALLAGASRPVLVPHARVLATPVGTTLGGEDMPERPPAVPSVPTGLTACASGPASVDVHPTGGRPPGSSGAAPGLLARVPGGGELVLVAGGRAHAIPPDALLALGYARGQVREVPAAWLALFAVGEPLSRLRPAPTDGAGGVAGPVGLVGPGEVVAVGGVAQVGRDGDVVEGAASGRRYLVEAGSVHPFLNRTSELLSPDPVRAVPDGVLLAAAAGAPVGVADVPDGPPVVPPADAAVLPCVDSSTGLLTLPTRPPRDDAVPPLPSRRVAAPSGSGAAGAEVDVSWHFPPGEGALLSTGSANVDEERRLVAAGVGYRIGDVDALRFLGYRPEQTERVSSRWLALLDPGVDLVVMR